MRTLSYAILGLLARSPRTGYELSKAMDRPIGYFWPASHSTIYPELIGLERLGYVRHRVEAGPGPRDTKRYSITAAGRRELIRWTAETPVVTTGRSELMLRVRNLWLLTPERAVALIESVRTEAEVRLATYEAEEDDFAASGSAHEVAGSPEFDAFATLQYGLGYERNLLAWCTWLIERLGEPRPGGAARALRGPDGLDTLAR